MIQLQIPANKSVYFASDFHLGFPSPSESLDRERRLSAWMDSIQPSAAHLFLMGDLFDFWFEYGKVVPQGFTRFIGKLGELADKGTQIHIFVGNHDLWMKDFFTKELNAIIYHEPQLLKLCFSDSEKWLWIGHGDGLGPGDNGYKMLKKVFTNPLAKFLFKWLHPNLGVSLAHFWSESRKKNYIAKGGEPFNEQTDYILNYVKELHQKHVLEKVPVEAYVFGHRHHPVQIELGNQATYYNLGDWFTPNYQNAYILAISDKLNHFHHLNA